MKLKDILSNSPLVIHVRLIEPSGEDMPCGYCYWTGKELVSGDGDNYSVEDEVCKYEFHNDGKDLTYWFEGEWI